MSAKHARQQIREGFETLLKTAPLTSWKSVQPQRIASTRQIWPYMMVFSENDKVETMNENQPAVYLRTVKITTIGMLRLPSNNDKQTIEDKMDALALDIETRITFAALIAVPLRVQSLVLIDTEMELVANPIDETIDHAEVMHTWEVGYATLEGAPQTLL